MPTLALRVAPPLRRGALLLGCSICLFEDCRDGAVGQRRVQVDADPAADADVWRDEEVLGVGGDEIVLRTGRRVAPDGDAAIAVMIVREHREQLAVHAPRRLAPGKLLLGVRHAEADFADESKDLLRMTKRLRGRRTKIDLRGIADLELGAVHHLFADLDPELLRTRHDRTVEPDSVDGADHGMT